MNKNVLKLITGVALLALTAFLAGGIFLFGDILLAVNTIQELESNLYALEYKGDYGFDAFLESGGASSDAEVAAYLTSFLSRGFYKPDTTVSTGEFGCSTVCIKEQTGQVTFGRNYDWAPCSAMIVHTEPRQGYESVSTCCLDFLGFGKDYQPTGSLLNKMMSLAAIYVPLDGMNEKGLMVADLMAGDTEVTHQNAGKPDLTTTTAIRLLLDRAANVEEALELLRQYDMHSSMDSAHHLSIADASGRSVVAEYINGELIVTETPVVTNHYLAPGEKHGIGSAQSHTRFESLSRQLEAGKTNVDRMLQSVAQKNYPQTPDGYEKTMWSIVYHPVDNTARFYFAENYEHSYRLALQSRYSWLVR